MSEYLQKVSLLYAEDEKDVQSNMKEYFESYFNNVYTAFDGVEALEIYKKYTPEVVVLDINMPHMNGLDVAKEIRKISSQTRIIMLSAHSEKEILLQATEIDMSKYVLKPIDPYEFKDVLKKVAKELLNLTPEIIKIDEIFSYDKKEKTLSSGSNKIELSEKEQKLLELLANNINKTVTFEDIMANVWDNYFNEEISKDSVKSQVNNLRQKLPRKSLLNVYGQGYCLYKK